MLFDNGQGFVVLENVGKFFSQLEQELVPLFWALDLDVDLEVADSDTFDGVDHFRTEGAKANQVLFAFGGQMPEGDDVLIVLEAYFLVV